MKCSPYSLLKTAQGITEFYPHPPPPAPQCFPKFWRRNFSNYPLLNFALISLCNSSSSFGETAACLLNSSSHILSYPQCHSQGRSNLCQHKLNLFGGQWHQQGPVGRASPATSQRSPTDTSDSMMPTDRYASLNTATQKDSLARPFKSAAPDSELFCRDAYAHARSHLALWTLCFWIWHVRFNANFHSIPEHQSKRKDYFT